MGVSEESVIPLRILYVEDDEGLAQLFKRRMERLAHTAEIAADGETGIAMFMQGGFDAIVLDYRLPGEMSGLDVLRRIKPVDGEPPVILLTAGGDEGLAVEAFKMGAADYLSKDVNQVYLDLMPAVLNAAVTKVRLKRQTERQQDDLRYYISQLEAEISLRKLSEERLKKSEERLQLAYEGTNDGLWDWNIAEDDIYFSPRWKAILGYSDDEFPNLASASIELIHPDDREETMESLRQFMAGESEVYHVTFRQRHKNGSWIWILSRATGRRNENGVLTRMIGAHTDVTDLKNLQLELTEAYEKANMANIAKSEFLANMSHEIRTPMNAVIGLAGILSRTQPLSPQQKEFITTLQLSAESLLSLINDLLDISKIETRNVELEHIPFRPYQVVTDVVSILQLKAEERGLELSFDAPGIEAIECEGDPTRFYQIMMNLGSNALKFTETGGVYITAERQPDKDVFVFRIRDTGIGIDETQLSTIFEKFIQADLSITRRYGGSGLGLAITKTLVELMDGSIDVQSLVGLGSVFTLQLPLKVLSISADILPSEPPLERVALNEEFRPILLVEDNASNRLVITTYLGEAGYAYDVASEGRGALEMIARHRYPLILMDVQMRDLDGFETTRLIREQEEQGGKTRSIIVGMTAHALTGDRERCLAAGMDDYLSKPFGPKELSNLLQRHVGVLSDA